MDSEIDRLIGLVPEKLRPWIALSLVILYIATKIREMLLLKTLKDRESALDTLTSAVNEHAESVKVLSSLPPDIADRRSIETLTPEQAALLAAGDLSLKPIVRKSVSVNGREITKEVIDESIARVESATRVKAAGNILSKVLTTAAKIAKLAI